MKYSIQECIDKMKDVQSYSEGIKLVYMWVKQDKITPQVMAGLNIFLYKKFNY